LLHLLADIHNLFNTHNYLAHRYRSPTVPGIQS